MGLLQEFKEFAMRGNVVDMAVGIVIGGAFGGIVNSLVKDVVMPPIGMAMNKVDFTSLKVVLQEKAGDAAEVSINYGLFITTVINFIIVALAIFVVIKAMNTLKKKQADAPPPPAPLTKDQELLGEIRDALKAR